MGVENLPRIAAAAVACEQRTGLPASIVAAQCILESGWLKSAPGNNCFGIKAHDGHHRQLLETTEWLTDEQARGFNTGGRRIISRMRAFGQEKSLYRVIDWFAAYNTLADCFADHAELVTNGAPYAKAWQSFQEHHDAERLASEIAPIYATAPSYGASILELMRQANVVNAIARPRPECI